jgi:hypothetical protein
MTDEDCACEFDWPEPDDEESWHYARACPECACQWGSLHCAHDGIQNPCPVCGWLEHGKRLPSQVLGLGSDRKELQGAAWELMQAAHLGFDINAPDVQRVLIEASKRRRAEADERETDRLAKAKAAAAAGKQVQPESVVYYMRVGNRVKIGYSTNLASRIAAVMPEEVLATEPGGRLLEEVRHRQFSDLRVGREWFRHEGRLADHIENLQRSPCAT